MGTETKDAVQILKRRFPGKTAVPTGVAGSVHAKIAQHLRVLRKQCGLTQLQLAKRVGTSQRCITRYEDVDYRGHTISVLSRIAYALGERRVGVYLWRPNDGRRHEV